MATDTTDNRAADTAADDPRAITGWVVGLLAALMFINYADRGSLAVAAPVLKDVLHIPAGQMGILLSAFFWTYAASQPVAGWIAQRFAIRWVLVAGLVTWAGATALCGLAAGFGSLLLLRLAVGLGESVIFPANARILAEHAPDHKRGGANAAISMGLFLGPAAGTLIGGMILAHAGWRAVFFGLGAASLLWIVPWLATPLPQDRPKAASEAGQSPPGFGAILRQRGLWGVAMGQFCYAYTTYLMLTWLPLFLVKAEGFSLVAMAWIGALVPICQAAGSWFSGATSDRMIAQGQPGTRVRKRFMVGGMGASAVWLLATAFAGRDIVIVPLCCAAFCSGVMSPLSFTTGQTLAGPRAAGRWMGLQNLIGNLSGIAAPMVTGFVVQATGSFHFAFVIAAGMAVIGLVAWGIVLPEIEPIAWEDPGLAAGIPVR